MSRSLRLVPASSAGPATLLRWTSVVVASGAVLAILGPFGSYLNGGPLRRFGYWTGGMLLGLPLYGLAYRIVTRSPPAGAGRWWSAVVGAALLASVPEALATRAAASWLWPELARLHLSGPLWFAQTAAMGLIATAGIAFLRRSTSAQDHAPPPALEPVATTLGGDVLALQMEDHYVRVHRPTGSELILMPLGRAINSVHADGLRTHRSWWVASHAVAAVEGNARSMRLRLSNGLVAPVARSAVAHLKAAGWIADGPTTRSRAPL